MHKTKTAGLSSLGVPGVPWHTQILADQLTLFRPRGTDYAHIITTGTPQIFIPSDGSDFVREKTKPVQIFTLVFVVIFFEDRNYICYCTVIDL